MNSGELILKLLEGRADYFDRKAAYKFISENTDRRALLELLAEEAAEVSQAALKLIRAEGNGCPTNVNQKAAFDDLREELSDLHNVVKTLEVPLAECEGDEKLARWLYRLIVKTAHDKTVGANTCVCCGAVIPEKKTICKNCLRTLALGGEGNE